MYVSVIEDVAFVIVVHGDKDVLSGGSFSGDPGFGFLFLGVVALEVEFDYLFCWEDWEGLAEFKKIFHIVFGDLSKGCFSSRRFVVFFPFFSFPGHFESFGR